MSAPKSTNADRPLNSPLKNGPRENLPSDFVAVYRHESFASSLFQLFNGLLN
jgi:hypothetical protein